MPMQGSHVVDVKETEEDDKKGMKEGTKNARGTYKKLEGDGGTSVQSTFKRRLKENVQVSKESCGVVDEKRSRVKDDEMDIDPLIRAPKSMRRETDGNHSSKKNAGPTDRSCKDQ